MVSWLDAVVAAASSSRFLLSASEVLSAQGLNVPATGLAAGSSWIGETRGQSTLYFLAGCVYRMCIQTCIFHWGAYSIPQWNGKDLWCSLPSSATPKYVLMYFKSYSWQFLNGHIKNLAQFEAVFPFISLFQGKEDRPVHCIPRTGSKLDFHKNKKGHKSFRNACFSEIFIKPLKWFTAQPKQNQKKTSVILHFGDRIVTSHTWQHPGPFFKSRF